jgi:hypothetical protein
MSDKRQHTRICVPPFNFRSSNHKWRCADRNLVRQASHKASDLFQALYSSVSSAYSSEINLGISRPGLASSSSSISVKLPDRFPRRSSRMLRWRLSQSTYKKYHSGITSAGNSTHYFHAVASWGSQVRIGRLTIKKCLPARGKAYKESIDRWPRPRDFPAVQPGTLEA